MLRPQGYKFKSCTRFRQIEILFTIYFYCIIISKFKYRTVNGYKNNKFILLYINNISYISLMVKRNINNI